MYYSKSDWKLFQDRIPKWQEAYMDKLLKEYIKLLEGPELPSAKFWKLKQQMAEDVKSPGVLIKMTKKDMLFIIVDLIALGAITINDLEGFSNELIQSVEFQLNIINHT